MMTEPETRIVTGEVRVIKLHFVRFKLYFGHVEEKRGEFVAISEENAPARTIIFVQFSIAGAINEEL